MVQDCKSGNLQQKKKKNTDHKTAKTFKLGVAIKPSGLFFIVNKSQRRWIQQILVGNYSHLLLKYHQNKRQALSKRQKPVCIKWHEDVRIYGPNSNIWLGTSFYFHETWRKNASSP